MKDSKALLLEYLASIRDPECAASLFADDGVFEMPFLRSLGVEPRYTGRREITALLDQLLKLYPNFAFAPDDIRVLIETPEKTFAEYVVHAGAPLQPDERSINCSLGTSWPRPVRSSYCAKPSIRWRRRTRNCRMELADIGRPGDEVHSF